MNITKKINRVGLIGFGNRALIVHLPLLQNSEHFKLVAVLTRTDKAKVKIQALGASHHTQLQEFLKQDLDLIIILTPAQAALSYIQILPKSFKGLIACETLHFKNIKLFIKALLIPKNIRKRICVLEQNPFMFRELAKLSVTLKGFIGNILLVRNRYRHIGYHALAMLRCYSPSGRFNYLTRYRVMRGTGDWNVTNLFSSECAFVHEENYQFKSNRPELCDFEVIGSEGLINNKQIVIQGKGSQPFPIENNSINAAQAACETGMIEAMNNKILYSLEDMLYENLTILTSRISLILGSLKIPNIANFLTNKTALEMSRLNRVSFFKDFREFSVE